MPDFAAEHYLNVVRGTIGTHDYPVWDAMSRSFIPGRDNKAQRLKRDFRATVLYLYPNGEMPLTALLSFAKKNKCINPKVEWSTEIMPKKQGVIKALYVDPAFTTPYPGSGRQGDTLYLHVNSETSQYFREGNQVLLRMAGDPLSLDPNIQLGDPRVDVTARVQQVTDNSINSCVAVSLLEHDDNAPLNVPIGAPARDLRNANFILCLGSVNPEGSSFPDSRIHVPSQYYNFTQIFIDSLSITRTAHQTSTYTSTDGDYGDNFKKMLEEHARGLEMSFLYSRISNLIGVNGEPQRTMQGLIPFIKQEAYYTDFRYETDPAVRGKTWQDGWYSWLTLIASRVFEYGSGDARMVFIGSRAFMALNEAVMNRPGSHFTWTSATTVFGMKVIEFVTPFGTLYVRQHTLMSRDPVDAYTMVIFDVKDLAYRFLQDTIVVDGDTIKKYAGKGWWDGIAEGVLTEATLTYDYPIKCAYATGFGLDNLM